MSQASYPFAVILGMRLSWPHPHTDSAASLQSVESIPHFASLGSVGAS